MPKFPLGSQPTLFTHVVSWKDLLEDVASLARRLPPDPWDRVLGIGRGGIVPAVLLARYLDVRCVETVQVVSYLDSRKEPSHAPSFLRCPRPSFGPSGLPTRTLIVDDIVGTGDTMRMVAEAYPAATLSVLYSKEGPFTDRVVFSARAVSSDVWYVFPWEVDPIGEPDADDVPR